MSSTNYRTDFFEFETLTPIRGKPDFQSLTTLKNQIKANAQAVPSTLGGGNHGLLGLVLTNAEYAVVSAVPYLTEPYPGALQFPNGTTAIQSKMVEDAYRKRMKLYDMCVGVEKALTQQIVKAVHADWLKPLRNAITNTIQGTIPEILTFLFNTHGNISPDTITNMELGVKNMEYDAETEPIDNIFTKIEELVEFAAAAGAPYSRPQIINIAYVILKRLKIFNSFITEWNKKVRATPALNTWSNFKTFFRTAYDDLREVGELRIADTTFNQANLVTQIVDAVQESLAYPPPSDSFVPSVPMEPVPQSVPQVNNAYQHTSPAPQLNTQDPMSALVQQMMLMNTNLMNSMQSHHNNGANPSHSNPGRGGGRGRNSGRNSGRGRSNRNSNNNRSFIMRYCWSCGWCLHDGNHCRSRKEGHKVDANVSDRMGGSTDGLPPGFE